MQLGKHDVPWLPLHALWEPINFRHFWATTALKTEWVSCQTYLTPTRTFPLSFTWFRWLSSWLDSLQRYMRAFQCGRVREAKKEGEKVKLHTVSASAQIRRRIRNSVGLTDCSCVHSALTTPEWLRRGCLKTLTHTHTFFEKLSLSSLSHLTTEPCPENKMQPVRTECTGEKPELEKCQKELIKFMTFYIRFFFFFFLHTRVVLVN